jgi:hypothetical protein
LADGHGEYLRDDEMPLGITDHPYSDFRPNEVMGEFLPRPIATDLVPLNQWYNMAKQAELQAMQKSAGKVFVRKGSFDTDAADAFSSNEHLAFVELDIKQHEELARHILPYTPPNLSDTVYRGAAAAANDFDEVGGISEAGRGHSGSSTATEASITESYSGSRIDFDRKVLAECWRRIAKKLNDSIDANMTKERAVQLVGDDGQVFTALVDRDMIAGDFDVEIDVEDMAQPNTAMQNAGKTQVMQIAGQAPWMFTDEALARGWLEPYGVKDQNFIDALVESAKAQMEMMMMQATPPGPSAESDAPTSEAQAISQDAAGMQARNMQGAT